MALTQDQINDLNQYLYIVNNLAVILDKETTINPTVRAESGISDDNIVNLNNTMTNALNDMDLILDPPVVPAIAPTITLITPLVGVGGIVVTIAGNNLTDAVVTFNGEPAVLTTNTDILIETTVPLAAITGIITITTPNGTTFSDDVFVVSETL